MLHPGLRVGWLLLAIGCLTGCHSPGAPASPSATAATSGAGGGQRLGLLGSAIVDQADGRDPFTTAQGDGRFRP